MAFLDILENSEIWKEPLIYFDPASQPRFLRWKRCHFWSKLEVSSDEWNLPTKDIFDKSKNQNLNFEKYYQPKE